MQKVLTLFIILTCPVTCFSVNHSKDFVMLYQFTKIKKENKNVEQKMLPILPVKLFYEPAFNLKHHDTTQPIPSKRILNIVAQRIKKETNIKLKQYTILDIETWRTDIYTDENTVMESISKYIFTITEMKKLLPDYRIGNYGKPIHRNYRASIGNTKNDQYNQWISRNDMLKPLADILDVFYPSLYTFEENKIDTWVKYAKEHIKESRRLATRNQPVIAFIWPQYHNRSRYKGKFIEYEFWKIQLETLFGIADGVVIWSNHHGPLDTESGWFKATRNFVDSLDSQGIQINAFINQ